MTKPKNTWRNIPERDRVILWGRAAARCCFPNCRTVLIEPATSEDSEATFGQAAHIVAHSSGGPRASVTFPADKLDKYENLLLLCGNHHTIVDRQPNTYTVDDLRTWKAEHENWILTKTEPSEYTPSTWQMIVQEDSPQIDVKEAANSVEPDVVASQIHYLQVSHKPDGWDAAARLQGQQVESLIQSVPPSDRRFAIFSLTRIPLAIHLGFVLSDRCRTSLFQFHRDKGTWRWPKAVSHEADIPEPAFREFGSQSTGPVVLRISLSAVIADELAVLTVPNAIGDIHLRVEKPDVTWLQCVSQLERLAALYRGVFAQVLTKFNGRCSSIHILYAGPTGGAIALGRSINPRMNPPVHLYEYQSGRYEPALILSEK